MSHTTRVFEHNLESTEQIVALLPQEKITHILVKPLPKNANDKNQVYWASSFEMLSSLFDLKFGDRGTSTSLTKRKSDAGKPIPEAVFSQFEWLDTAGNLIPANNVKMLVYAQYPEMRLSGFKTIENQIPESLSVTYVKEHPELERVMVLARTHNAGAIGMIVIPQGDLLRQIKELPNFMGSRVVKLLKETTTHTNELNYKLGEVAERWLRGVRFSKDGETLAFNGTQVCGYTLEHALGIRPNANKDGDYKGIELKTHTSNKVTLMTPEPDRGEYFVDFKAFMTKFGYWDAKSDSYRFTGVHTANLMCKKTGLTLKVENYNRNEDFAKQMDRDIHIGLFTKSGELAAGWSLERLLNCWGAKHNETVYIFAHKRNAEQEENVLAGSKYEICFSRNVLWCKRTSAQRLLNAILDGVIILDPAPKYVPSNPSDSKRRSQWRVNNLFNAVESLYESVEKTELNTSLS